MLTHTAKRASNDVLAIEDGSPNSPQDGESSPDGHPPDLHSLSNQEFCSREDEVIRQPQRACDPFQVRTLTRPVKAELHTLS
eukprot:8431944-Pyramimonas_sp.AAC.1